MILLNSDNKIFVIYVITLAKLEIISIYLFHKAHITLQRSVKIFIEYFNFSNIFFSNFLIVN